MNKKYLILPLLVISILVGLAVVTIAQADGYGKSHTGLEQKIFYKAKFILQNEEELGISEEQAATIKAIKFETKKELVMKNAEIDLVAIDIKDKLYADKIDVEAVEALIDKKYDLKKAKAKYLVIKYSELKSVLTDEQMKKMKKLCLGSCKR